MKPLAEKYLAEEQVKDYTDLKITCVDTITEVGYAQLTVELLGNMEAASEEQYANQEGDHSPEVQYLMLQDIYKTKEALEEALTSGGLSSKGVLLYMVTGTYLTPNKEQKEVVFLVNADKKSLHTLDPFGDNLVLQ